MSWRRRGESGAHVLPAVPLPAGCRAVAVHLAPTAVLPAAGGALRGMLPPASAWQQLTCPAYKQAARRAHAACCTLSPACCCCLPRCCGPPFTRRHDLEAKVAALEAQQAQLEAQQRVLEAARGELGTSRSRIQLIEKELQVGAPGVCGMYGTIS